MITFEEVKRNIREDITKNDYLILTTKCYELGINTIEELLNWRRTTERYIMIVIEEE